MANQKLLKKVAPVVLSAAMAMTSMPTVAMAADFSDSDVVSDAVEVEETPDAETETEVEVDTEEVADDTADVDVVEDEDADTAETDSEEDLFSSELTEDEFSDQAGDDQTTGEAYVLMNIPYDDFYKAELKNNDVKVDAFTSATLNKSRTAGMMNGNSAYHTDVEGTNLAGVTFPVKVSDLALLKDQKKVTDDDSVTITVTNKGQTASNTYTGKDALVSIEKAAPDMALLDVMLPDIDGFEVLQKIREKYNFPVIMLTAKTEYMDKINGLMLGADDYMAKPFNPLELIARVKAQMRRFTKYNTGGRAQEDVIDFGNMFLNRTTHECIYNEKHLTLTPIEFDILWLLCDNRGQVISSERLFEEVWKEKYYKNSNNTVMVHIRHLREKMSGPTGKSNFIKTVWGVGYRVEK